MNGKNFVRNVDIMKKLFMAMHTTIYVKINMQLSDRNLVGWEGMG